MQRSATSDGLAAHIKSAYHTVHIYCKMCHVVGYRCVYGCVYRCREEPPRMGQAAADTAVSPFPPAAAGTLFHVCKNGHTCEYTCAAEWSHSHTGFPIKERLVWCIKWSCTFEHLANIMESTQISTRYSCSPLVRIGMKVTKQSLLPLHQRPQNMMDTIKLLQVG